MSTNAIAHSLAQRFHLESAPSFVARAATIGTIAFTHLKSPHPLHGRSESVPREAAFSIHVPLSLPFFSDLWIDGNFKGNPPAPLGCAYLYDLTENPVVSLDTPFDSFRFYVSQAALDELAYDRGLRRVGGLHTRTFGGRDLVMYGLAQSLAAAMDENGECTSLFADHVALAFHDHIIRAYGDVPVGDRKIRGGLAPWQVRRAQEFIDANLDGDPSIAQLARECGLSRSYFTRAFRQAMGMPPHQWLTKRRVEEAKQLMQETRLELVEISIASGFADQSHFTRVFSRSEGLSPGAWRRIHSREERAYSVNSNVGSGRTEA
jgi:AraC family transcriptional regulator